MAEEEEKKETKNKTSEKPEEKQQSSPQIPKKDTKEPKEPPVAKTPSAEPAKTEKIEEDKSPTQAPSPQKLEEKVKEEKGPEVKKEPSKEPSKESPKEPSKESPKEPSKEPPKESPKEPSKESPKEPSKESPKEPSKESPKEPSKAPPKESPKEPSKAPPKESPKEPSKAPPKESPKDKTKDKKEVGKVPKGDSKAPKKGGDKEDRGKPKEVGVKTKDKTDELLLRFSPLIFGKYDLSEVTVEDPGLRKYINLSPMGLPHSGARHANKSFGKMKVNIVERLINNMMRTEHTTGKKSFTYKMVSQSFDIIAKRTKTNPVQVLINALQNSSPKEEITRLRFGGISVPKAVDTSSAHRLDVAIRNICKGTVSSSHKNKKRMALCLAEEIILASKADMNSFAISKKEEMERIASSAR